MATRVTAARLWQRPSRQQAAAAPGFEQLAGDLHATISSIGATHPAAALASSLSIEDMVLLHAIVHTGAPIGAFFIDTGRLHPETLALLDQVPAALGIRIRVLRPDPAAVASWTARHGLDGFRESVELRHACCALRKVQPLQRALEGCDAWLTGQRRGHGPDRAALEIREHDALRDIAKFNPLAHWPDEAVWHYADRFELPVNRLHVRGYPSIGCEPCTRAIRTGEDPRAGRWWWERSATKECGLHWVHPDTETSR
ncbi:MAG: phosphoadenylyl-sulfate reductase [Pseudomonadota bacterium]